MQTSAINAGQLFIVATPIGNIMDISLRALTTLKDVDYIACEDTRVSKKLLNAHGINTKLLEYSENSSPKEVKRLIALLLAGKNIAVVSDAGTPLVSDPGKPLLRMANENAIKITPIPGPSAVTTFLSVIVTDAKFFTFHGFFPRESKERKIVFEHLALNNNGLHIFFESPKRIIKTLELLKKTWPEAKIVLGRELTKLFEEVINGTPEELITYLQSNNKEKGEFIFAIEFGKKAEVDLEKLLRALLQEMSLKDAVKEASSLTNLPKSEVYQLALQLRDNV
jgi:16S rRNA (cytidine1402-2'-O)-methyltransferase